MVKRKYLKCLILNVLLISCEIKASAWLPEPKKYKITSSYSQIDYVSEKEQLERIEAYRYVDDYIDQIIAFEKQLYLDRDLKLYEIKESKLSPENKQKNINLFLAAFQKQINELDVIKREKIEKLNRFATYQDEIYAKNILEYGLAKNLSLGVSSSINRNHFLSSKHTKDKSNGGSTEIFVKLKMFQDKKYIVSLQPKFYIDRISGFNDQTFAEISLLTGTIYKGRFGEVFLEGWIGSGKCISNSCNNKKYIHYSISEGYKMPFGLMFSNFTRYYIRKNYGEVYNRTIYNQLSIAKEIYFGTLNRHKLTFQIGYFTDRSITSKITRCYKVSGSVFSVWLDT